jgi:hypothetical protein
MCRQTSAFLWAGFKLTGESSRVSAVKIRSPFYRRPGTERRQERRTQRVKRRVKRRKARKKGRKERRELRRNGSEEKKM